MKTWMAVLLGGCVLCSARFVSAADDIQFRDVTADSGIAALVAGMMGHGAAWGDFDRDGLPDLFVGGFCDRPDAEYAPASGPVPNRLFRNLGNGKFARIPEEIVEVYGRTSGAVFADLNNNGWLDLYVANNAKPGPVREGTPAVQAAAKQQRSLLFRNVHGEPLDFSSLSGACPETLHTARNIAVLDTNGNGLLDLLVVEDRFRRGPRSILFENQGEFRFKDVTAERGLPDDLFGLGHAVADLNDDGRPDFIIGHSNRCFLSTPDGKYVEAKSISETLAWDPLHNEDWPCGVAIGDLNRDGLLDIVIAAHCNTARNRVFLNEGLVDGVPKFRDVTREIGFPESIPVKCPHVEIQDFNNDGWPDIYFSAGWKNDDGSITPLIFENRGLRDGLPRFQPPRTIGGDMVYYPAGPSADFDQDGRIDLFLVNWFSGDQCHLLRNVGPTRRWLQVTVSGTTFNRMGLGTRVWLYESGKSGEAEALLGMQELQIGSGYASGHEAVLHFGLGDATEVDLVARLPDGREVKRPAVKANQRFHLSE